MDPEDPVPDWCQCCKGSCGIGLGELVKMLVIVPVELGCERAVEVSEAAKGLARLRPPELMPGLMQWLRSMSKLAMVGPWLT